MLAGSVLEVVPWGKLADDNWVVPLGAAVVAVVAFSQRIAATTKRLDVFSTRRQQHSKMQKTPLSNILLNLFLHCPNQAMCKLESAQWLIVSKNKLRNPIDAQSCIQI